MSQFRSLVVGSIAVLVLTLPAAASAQSITDLQSQINSLVATITALQAQLNILQRNSPTTSTIPSVSLPLNAATTPSAPASVTPTVTSTVTPSTAPSVGVGAPSCSALTLTLARGSVDGTTGGQVSVLQAFLTNYFKLSENIVSGYFGVQTEKYVTQFQAQNGLDPVGYAGQLTRAAITAVCNGTAAPTIPTPPIPTATSTIPAPVLVPPPSVPQVPVIPPPAVTTITNTAPTTLSVSVPPVCSIQASPTTIVQNTPTLLTWASGGATLAAWSDDNTIPGHITPPSTGLLPTNGSVSFTPTLTLLSGQTQVISLTLKVGNTSGMSATCTAYVTVIGADTTPPPPPPPPTTTGSIDANSLYATTYTPTLSGSASSTAVVGISIGDNGGKAYGSGTVSVLNGRWSVTVSPALNPQTNPYSVSLYDGANKLLASGSLVITPPPPPPPATTTPPTNTSPQLLVAGVYEGQGAQHSGCYSKPGSVTVTVPQGTRPITLALVAYEPVNWTVNAGGNTIQKVILAGYNPQSVAGISAPIEKHFSMDYNRTTGTGTGTFYDTTDATRTVYHSPTSSNCASTSGVVPEANRAYFVTSSDYFYAYQQSDSNYANTAAKLTALTGLPVSGFVGGYSGSQLSFAAGSVATTMSNADFANQFAAVVAAVEALQKQYNRVFAH